MILLDKALKYCDDVIEGKEITTWEVKKQCSIFIQDYYDNQYKEEFEFYADEKKMLIVNNLLKLLNFPTGFVAGKQVLENLAPFQCFLLAGVFLFRYKNNPLKFKNNDITLFISRKNAKTSLVSIIFIILMLTEQRLSEFYSICLSKELAAELRKGIAQTIESSPLISKHFTISKTFTGVIKCKLTGSFYQPRVAEAGKNNSVRPSAICSDEHANFKDADNFNAMKGGMKNVINPIVFRTTTAYAIDNSIMEEDLHYIRSVLNGTVTNPRQFALVYYAEEKHLWDDIGMYMANPLRNEENYNTIKENRERAKIKISEQEEYLTKEMNVFVAENELNKYIDISYWKKCRVDNIDFSNKNVIVGIDLSVTTDLTAVSIMYKENNIIYCMSHGFLPADSLDKRRENIDYKKYEREDYCDIHKGMTVNYTLVEEYIRNIESKYGCTIETIVTDPMNAKEMVERLEKDFDVVKLKQTYTNLSPSTKEFRKKVYDGQVKYEKNELLDWCMSNAITTVGKSDDEMLAKEDKNKQRIDMVAVLIFAYTELIGEDYTYNALEELEKMSEDW
ncbi:terminase large subunit [Clostridium botulinum]|uniref:terminase large subunit n=1 Tax=Clostridium botulinum TaxID=1491 RepID=UPI00099E18DE|nr:terminase TerL endonuclease subunit [Clostridium botulinum]OPD21415.1 terminase [Clostridium botulinum]